MNIVLIPMGGLGNLIFQFLFVFSLSKTYINSKLYVCYEYQDKRDNITKYKQIFEKFCTFVTVSEIKKLEQPFQEYREPVWKYHQIPNFTKCGTLIVNGYFQSWKYFTEDIIREFRTDWKHNVNYGTVCVHVRRGDYKNLQNIHPLMTEEYYKKTMMNFSDDYTFLVFAEFQDDEEFRNWSIWKKYSHVKFINEKDPLKTLIMMSECEHFIIPNSTLSLCAYYLRSNSNARLFAPGNWFGPDGPNFDMNEIIKPHSSRTSILYQTN